MRTRMIPRTLKILLLCGLVCFILKWLILLVGEESRPTPTSEELGKLMEEAELENTKRLLTIKASCEKYRLGMYRVIVKHPPAPQYTVFYIDRVHNLSYCPIYKAGSTTWIYNLCLLMRVPETELNSGREQISTIARRVIPELEFPEADEALKASAKLLVVRHPFERLVSAYRDKLENSVAGREHGTLHFYQKYGAKIVQKYREVNWTKPRTEEIIKREGVAPPAGIEPTFREFVQYLIDTDLANYGDDHWIPYYLFCTPCILQYDIVAKVESLWRDQIYAIHKLGLQEVIKPKWRHATGTGYSNASRIYFRQIDKKLVNQLYEKFKFDFELFDYSPDYYYRYAN